MSWATAAGGVELVAEFTALPGREQEVERLLLDLTHRVRAEAGCLVFDPYVVTGPPSGAGVVPTSAPDGTRFVVVEAYRDGDAFAAHLAAPHGAVFNAALAPLIAEPDGSRLTFLRRLA
jgi:quinol monooxygenase YgiN